VSRFAPALLLAALFGATAPADAQQSQEPVIVYLVRHAERAEDGTDDPPISAAGEQRALLLAEMLRDTEITYIHTTDFRRTRATAEPVADDIALEPAMYRPDQIEVFAARLRATPGRHLVVGHSNTTTELVAALGGDPHGEIAQDEYDRLYVLTLSPAGTSTTLIRFGVR
jgi:probable phosphoglycerate mutase